MGAWRAFVEDVGVTLPRTEADNLGDVTCEGQFNLDKLIMPLGEYASAARRRQQQQRDGTDCVEQRTAWMRGRVSGRADPHVTSEGVRLQAISLCPDRACTL